MLKALVIEDDRAMGELIADTLNEDGAQVTLQPNAEQALAALTQSQPDIVFLDLGLPGMSGKEFLTQLRQKDSSNSDLPVIVLTGEASGGEQAALLDIGADDYVTKPFLPAVLRARMHAVLRRSQKNDPYTAHLVKGNLRVDFSAHKVMLEGNEVSLTLTEFRILSELMRESGKVLTRDSLRQRALGNLNVTDRTIDVHMASLRKKLIDLGDSIQTVRGVGYRFAMVS